MTTTIFRLFILEPGQPGFFHPLPSPTLTAARKFRKFAKKKFPKWQFRIYKRTERVTFKRVS